MFRVALPVRKHQGHPNHLLPEIVVFGGLKLLPHLLAGLPAHAQAHIVRFLMRSGDVAVHY